MEFGWLRDTAANLYPFLYLAADGINRDRFVKWKKSRGDSPSSHQSQQNVFRRDDLRAMQCLISGKKDDAAGTFCIAFKHKIELRFFSYIESINNVSAKNDSFWSIDTLRTKPYIVANKKKLQKNFKI